MSSCRSGGCFAIQGHTDSLRRDRQTDRAQSGEQKDLLGFQAAVILSNW